ncbi:uncharacterized protein LOC110696814 [Chenopodium quinoa]|uniref:uncharacterized protein LOC110696814 n=1 Tax=Chenopodium quinoa TaxID=63459 RepID=UPI000B79803A|nr:uncharacterized protein LOC110696814 [Chenopodium quinoa]
MTDDDLPPPPPPIKIESNSPYFLGPQDRPGDFITPTRLKGNNYEEWASDIQTALERRRKSEFLDGTIMEPQPPCTKSDWTAINAMLISWITNTIDAKIKSSLSKFREVKPFWDHLKQRFAQTNGPRVQQLRSSLAKCEQTKTMSVSIYYGKLHALWQELDHHEPLISCDCCSKCTAGRIHEVRREQSKLHDFLMGLYAGYYSALRTNILSQDPLPSLDRAYQLVTQEERERRAKQEIEEKQPAEAVGFAVRAAPTGGRGIKTCSHSTAEFGQAFSTEQWKALSGFSGNTKISDNRLNGKFDDTSWIIDTGETHHVTGIKSWLFDTHTVHYPMGLPNGDHVLATLAGSVCLNDKITIFGVLFVPNLNCNLISVSQLSDQLDVVVQFNSHMCAIQDRLKEPIGTGLRRDELYYLSKPDVVQRVSVVEATSDLDLWHRRMGHPSERVVKLLPHISNNKSSLAKRCDVCFRAQHHRDKFPLSDNKVSRIFEKVHCDLWGPYRHFSSCGARYFLTIIDDYSRAVWIYLLIDKTKTI